jgi:hypothetical protein
MGCIMIEVVEKVASLTLENYKQEQEIQGLKNELKLLRINSVEIVKLRSYFSSWEDQDEYLFVKNESKQELKALLQGVINKGEEV